MSGGTINAATPRTEPLGPSSRKTGLVISEIMYHPRDAFSGTNKLELEFVELFNSNPYFEDISGYRLSGDIDYAFPPGTVLQGGGFLVVARVPADVQSFYNVASVLGPFTNNLPNDGGRIRLRNNNGFVLLEVNYESRLSVAASRRTARAIRSCWRGPATAKTSARPGPRATPSADRLDALEPVSVEPLRTVVINEFLAHTDAPQVDFIELYNHSAQPVDVGGAWLTDNPATNKFRIPSPTIIPARGFVSFNQTQLGFSLSSAGERILLVNSNQTRVIDALDFERAGQRRFLRAAFPTARPSFRNCPQLTAGAANAAAARARHRDQRDHVSSHFGEQRRRVSSNCTIRGASAVNLGGWRFTDGINFRFPIEHRHRRGRLSRRGEEPNATCSRAIRTSQSRARRRRLRRQPRQQRRTPGAGPARTRHQRRRSAEHHHQHHLCRRGRSGVSRRRAAGATGPTAAAAAWS